MWFLWVLVLQVLKESGGRGVSSSAFGPASGETETGGGEEDAGAGGGRAEAAGEGADRGEDEEYTWGGEDEESWRAEVILKTQSDVAWEN